MSVLLLVEHNNKTMHPSVRNTLSAAKQLSEQITLLVIGHQCKPVAEQVAQLAGVHTVLLIDNPCYEHPLAENISSLILSLANSFTYIMATSTTYGKNILPRVAALLDVSPVSDVTRIVENNVFERPIFAGNAIETVKILDEKKVLTIRSTGFDAVTAQQTPSYIECIDTIFPASKSRFVAQELTQSTRPDLSNAQIIVSGGRGLQNAEKFKIIEELADVLNAGVGASRAAVDAGFVPNDYQVGQTGKIVAPTLYFAIGISGAVQHLAGMKDSKVIVAINKDADAPIFQIATYGLVGDLFAIIPELISKIKAMKQGVNIC